MSKFINDQPISHRSYNGTMFTAERADLNGGVKVNRSRYADEMLQNADFAEFASWHVTQILPELNGFPGWDAIQYKFVDEKKELESPKRKLPSEAYRALEALKAQASAVTLMGPGGDRAQGRKDLKAAQKLMFANEIWVNKIVRVVLAPDTKTNIVEADDEWLKRTFSK